MKIAVLLSRFPYPLEKGDKLRAYHQIKALSENHEIYLCALTSEKLDEAHLEELRPFCKEILPLKLTKLSIFFNLVFSLLFSNHPLQVAYFYNRKAKQKILNFIEKHEVDHIYCQLIRMAEYVRNYSKVPKTIDYMDALSRGMQRRIDKAPYYLKPFIKIETVRLKRYEHFIFIDFENKTIISEQDQKLIVHAKNEKIKVIPNGVDQVYFKPITKAKTIDILFTGNMSYPPNINSVEYLINQIMPIVWKSQPQLQVTIAGANPSARVLKLAGDNVTITGWVNDMRDYYAAAKIFIAPMQIGTGLQNKLLEAMAMKIPCITSPLANNALGAKKNEEILIGETPQEYATLIKQLLEDKTMVERLADSAFNFVNENYNWSASTKKLEALFLKHYNGRLREQN